MSDTDWSKRISLHAMRLELEPLVIGATTLVLLIAAISNLDLMVPRNKRMMDALTQSGIIMVAWFLATSYTTGCVYIITGRTLIGLLNSYLIRPSAFWLVRRDDYKEARKAYKEEEGGTKAARWKRISGPGEAIGRHYRTAYQPVLFGPDRRRATEIQNRRFQARLIRATLVPSLLVVGYYSHRHCWGIAESVGLLVAVYIVFLALFVHAEISLYDEAKRKQYCASEGARCFLNSRDIGHG